MALPASFNTITVTGAYLDFNGNPGTGTVTFTPPAGAYLKVTDVDVMVVPKPRVATLDINGTFSIVLPVTDDPEVVPWFTYTVSESVSGVSRTYSVEISTVLLPGPVDLSDLAPTGAVLVGTTALTRVTADLLYQPLGAAGVTSYGDLTDVPAAFTPTAHSHAQGDVTGLATALAGKAPTAHSHATADVTGLDTALSGKATAVAIGVGWNGRVVVVADGSTYAGTAGDLVIQLPAAP